MKLHKNYAARVARKASTEPSAKELEAINAYTIAPLEAGDVYVMRAYLAHNAIDRDGEAFNQELLDDFARTLPGKGLFIRHPGGFDGDSGPGVGRWFAAKVVQMNQLEAKQLLGVPDLTWPPGVDNGQAFVLEAAAYIPVAEKNAGLLADLRAGIASDVSIGFSASSRREITDGQGHPVAVELLGPGEALEGSLVWLGAQPGAATHKAAGAALTGDAAAAEIARLKAANADLERRLAVAYKMYHRQTMQVLESGGEPAPAIEVDLGDAGANMAAFGDPRGKLATEAREAKAGGEDNVYLWLAEQERKRQRATQPAPAEGKDLASPFDNPLVLGAPD